MGHVSCCSSDRTMCAMEAACRSARAPVVPVCVQACNVMLHVLLSCGTGRTVPVASPADVKLKFSYPT